MQKAGWASLAMAAVLFGGIAWNNGATAQATADLSMQALTGARDATLARRLVMNSIGANNDALHDMLDGVLPWDDFEFQARLFSMNALFMAFPHLYRAEPNPWTQEGEDADPAHISLALPSVWEEWDSFVALSALAAETTQRASFTAPEDVLPIVEELEAQCESCHEQFRKSFAEFHDFDMLPYPDGTMPVPAEADK